MLQESWDAPWEKIRGMSKEDCPGELCSDKRSSSSVLGT
jgi:hypothetical protein